MTSHSLERPKQITDLSLFQRLLDERLDVATVDLAMVKELKTFLGRNIKVKCSLIRLISTLLCALFDFFYLNDGIPDTDHVLGKVLNQAQETPNKSRM